MLRVFRNPQRCIASTRFLADHLQRTHSCGELNLKHAGEKVVLLGWARRLHKLGDNLAFLPIRDKYGTTQLVFRNKKLLETDELHSIHPESIISAMGTVMPRPESMINMVFLVF